MGGGMSSEHRLQLELEKEKTKQEADKEQTKREAEKEKTKQKQIKLDLEKEKTKQLQFIWIKDINEIPSEKQGGVMKLLQDMKDKLNPRSCSPET